VPRGSFPAGSSTVFSGLGRLIFDSIDRGVILMDDRRRILDANAMALGVLRDGNRVKVRSGRLVFSDAELDARFADLILLFRNGSRDAVRAIAARVSHDHLPPYRVVVAPVPPNVDDGRVAFFMLIYGPIQRRPISVAILGQVYGLTRAQAEVAQQLFSGLSVEATAAVLELSLNTVRTHLKHIFTRCGVQSQGELLQLLASGPQDL
jgi:DNA-binding CsgD family transcriptional regulator